MFNIRSVNSTGDSLVVMEDLDVESVLSLLTPEALSPSSDQTCYRKSQSHSRKAGFVAGNVHVRLEELTAHWVPVECISGFPSHTPSSCTN